MYTSDNRIVPVLCSNYMKLRKRNGTNKDRSSLSHCSLRLCTFNYRVKFLCGYFYFIFRMS